MDQWLPRLEGRAGPRYRVIADALQQDIQEGRLPSGSRLPTHRDLAWRLGVTVGTVTRAYVEAERRGLISGEVGRGTYVRPLTPDYPERRIEERTQPARKGHNSPAFIDLAGNEPPPAPLSQAIGQTMAEMAAGPDIEELLRYRPSQGMRRHREAAQVWLARFGVEAPVGRIVPTNGAQHAILLACSAAMRTGDVLLTESLTFFGIKSTARVLGLRLHGVEMDEGGLSPAALDAAIRATGSRTLYTIPTLQNPTNSSMSEARRQEIAEVCRRHEVVVIEDDIYNFLLETPLPPLQTFLPELALYVTNLSKSVAPALRVGYLVGPQPLIDASLVAMRASSIMSSPLLQEVGARLIEEGTAWRNAVAIREEVAARQELAGRLLGRWDMRRQPTSMHLWLQLPDPWRREAFAAECQRRGVGVAAADVFATGRQSMPHAVRVSVSAPASRDELEAGLSTIAEILGSEAQDNLPII